MAIEQTGLAGHVNMVLRDENGFLKEERCGPNVVTNVGLAELVLFGTGTGSPSAFSHIAIGTSDTAAAATQTTLGAEITTNGGERDASTVTAETENTAGDTIQLVSGWSFTGSLSIQESGVFNNDTTGTMLCRQTFTTLAVDNGDSLTITWKVTLDQA